MGRVTAVILPILPNAEFTPYRINPFKTWLVVVAVSAISYGSYVLLSVTKERSSVMLSAILGGAYSSTATTVALAKRAAQEQRPYLFSGGILMASGVMYLRLAVLLALFNRVLFARLVVPLIVLACIGGLGGWLWSNLRAQVAEESKREYHPRNPLELRAAVFFAAVFVAVLVLTRLTVAHLGKTGIYGLASLIGFMDVDPFVLGVAQSAGTFTPLSSAAASVLIAAASNNLAKGIYAFAFSDPATGRRSLALLCGLGVAGLIPLWLMS